MYEALRPIAPSLRFRIGITGHRGPPKMPAETEPRIRATVTRILATIAAAVAEAEASYRDLLADGPLQIDRTLALAPSTSKFVIISSVAEGADRLVADAGEVAGFGLEVVLPFSRAEYEKDFENADSKVQYRRLLGRATAVFELDGSAIERPRAYEAAGLIMLANCDLLVAIWNGEEAAGIGGTAHVVAQAIANAIPVVWIRPASPDVTKISWPAPGQIPPANALPVENFRDGSDAELKQAVIDIVAPPMRTDVRNALKRYLNESERLRTYHVFYAVLLRVFGIRRMRTSDFQPPAALDSAAREWRPFLDALPIDSAQRPALDGILLPAFAAADHIAVYYSAAYRSSYVFNFFFAAIAVAVALGGIFTHEPGIKSGLVVAELFIIGAILFGWRRGHAGEWHRRWLDYRRLAECMRHLRIFAPLGAEGPVDRPQRNPAGGEDDWVNWYTWSLRRLLPLPNRVVDEEYLKRLRGAIRNGELKGQIDYHRLNAKRMSKLDHRIHISGLTLFGTTAALCFVFAPLVWIGIVQAMADPAKILLLSCLTFFTALLPTLSAALGGIHAQGDFKTVAAQSTRTLQRLRAIGKTMKFDPLTFARLSDRVDKASEIMISDLLEWQTVFRTRPLSPPA